MSAKTYDSACFDLAVAFLEDAPHLATAKRTDELAALIQRTIEDFISYEQNMLIRLTHTARKTY